MAGLFERIRELLNRIYVGRVPTAAEVSAVVLEASVQKEPSAVASLIHFLLVPNGELTGAAVTGIEDIVRATPPMRFLHLDQALRDRSEYSWPFQRSWSDGFLGGRSLKHFSRGSVACLGLLACHPDGYVREAAVRAIADSRTGAELPFLLIRLNDWVRQVRTAARDAILARLTNDYIPHFVRYLPLVFHLKNQQRIDQEPQHAVIELLHRAKSRPALFTAVNSGDHHTARLAFQLLRESPDVPAQDLLDRGLSSWNPVLRLLAARLAHERLEGDSLRATFHRLASDKFMPIRRQALYAFHEKLPDEAPQHLHRALFDPHAAVRDTARFLLRQRGETPSASIYRDGLPRVAPQQLPTLIAALGEVGDASDVPTLMPFLDHPLAPIRTATLRACARLDGDPLAEQFLRLLRDDRSSKVSRTARDALLPRRHLVGLDRIWSVVEGPAWPHARRHALTLLADRDWWTSIEYFLRALFLDDEPLRSLALSLIQRRRGEIGRYSSRPSDAQFNRIADTLAAAEPRLDPAFVADVRTGLDYVRRNFPRVG